MLHMRDSLENPGESYQKNYVRDVTQKKELEKQVAMLSQLNLVGEMAAGIGHEIIYSPAPRGQPFRSGLNYPALSQLFDRNSHPAIFQIPGGYYRRLLTGV